MRFRLQQFAACVISCAARGLRPRMRLWLRPHSGLEGPRGVRHLVCRSLTDKDKDEDEEDEENNSTELQ